MGGGSSTSAKTAGGKSTQQSGAEGSAKERTASSSERKGNSQQILLLGSAGVGKTTILKQLMACWGKGFSDEQKKQAVLAIRKNMVTYAEHLVRFAAEEGTYNIQDDTVVQAETLEGINLSAEDDTKNEEIGKLIETILKDEEVIRARSELKADNIDDQLVYDSVANFLPKIDQVFSKDFVPSLHDIIVLRHPTKDITYCDIVWRSNEFRIKDVGGQIQHRESWRGAFAETDVVMFIVSLDDYNRVESKKNRLMEARELFKEIVQTDELKKCPIVVLLNKEDLFRKKVIKEPLSQCPAFGDKAERREGENDEDYTERALKYVFEYFRQTYCKYADMKEGDAAAIERYCTCATDDNFVSNSMMAVFKTFLTQANNSLANAGL